jgi:Asp-tRNA(Asn)/Glu-tRNA(Gln) amidotransferase A subunit family amidase
VGIRPTIGLISRTGIIPYSLTQDTAGPIARSVSDAARLLDFMAGYDSHDPVTAWGIGNVRDSYASFIAKDRLMGARIGVLESLFCTGPEHAEVNNVMRTSIDLMKDNGAGIVSINVPLDTDRILAEVSVHLYELREHLTRYLQNTNPPVPVKSLEDILAWGKHYPGFEAIIREAMSLSVTDKAYYERIIRRIHLQEAYLKIMADNRLDAIIYPHQKRLVVPTGQMQVDRNGVLTAATGFPSIVVPAGFSLPTETAPLGVPVGIEFAGRPWSEPLLIGLAYSFEQATMFRRPPISTNPVF